MSPDARIETFFDEDGEPWAVFTYGHRYLGPNRELELLPGETLRERFRHELCQHLDEAEVDEMLRDGAIVQFWIVDTTPEIEGEPTEIECPWQFCQPDTPGAIAVTGVKFQ